MTYKTVSRFARPSRSNAGIVLPEFPLFAALQELPVKLADGVYAADASEEPFISEILGLSLELSEAAFASLRQRPPHLALYLHRDRQQLPSITIQPETMTPTARGIGDDAGIEDEDVDIFDTPTELTPSGGAVGGETVFSLPSRPVVSGSVRLSVTRGSDTFALYAGAYPDFSVDSEKGLVTLASPLVAGDVLSLDSFAVYGLSGGEMFFVMHDFTHVILIDTWNPLITAVLVACVWRELMHQYSALQSAGLTDIEISRRSLSLWEDRVPPLGYRAELSVSGYTEWSTYKRVDFPRTLDVDMDTVSGDDSLLLMQAELASLGESPFVDSEE